MPEASRRKGAERRLGRGSQKVDVEVLDQNRQILTKAALDIKGGPSIETPRGDSARLDAAAATPVATPLLPPPTPLSPTLSATEEHA